MTTPEQKQQWAEAIFGIHPDMAQRKTDFIAGAEWQEQQDAKAFDLLQELNDYYGGAGTELLTDHETDLWHKVAQFVKPN